MLIIGKIMSIGAGVSLKYACDTFFSTITLFNFCTTAGTDDIRYGWRLRSFSRWFNVLEGMSIYAAVRCRLNFTKHSSTLTTPTYTRLLPGCFQHPLNRIITLLLRSNAYPRHEGKMQ